jgi:hypothetical protein
MTLSVWSEIAKSKELGPSDLDGISAWALRVYFNPSNKGKRWYKEGLTQETVLHEFTLPDSPISPEAMVEVWTAMPGLQAAIGRIDEGDLDAVADYLNRSKEEETESPRYTKGDRTLKDMAGSLGGITGTMVNKIFVSGTGKLQRLTGGVPLDDMEPEDLHEMFLNIEKAQETAANEFAVSLLSFDGNIHEFIKSQIACLNLTAIEAASLTENEFVGLKILSEMNLGRVVDILLKDLELSENLFRTFQNAASKKIFPRRSGRPKGSGKKRNLETATEEEI